MKKDIGLWSNGKWFQPEENVDISLKCMDLKFVVPQHQIDLL